MCAELAASNVKLKAKAAALEAQSRLNNVPIIGLPESIEGPQLTTFVSELLPQLLAEEILPTPPELDHTYKSLTAKPKQGEKPRPIIIRFHNFQTK